MLLELSDDEAVALRDFLTSRLGDLSAEISHTDNPAYRRDLRRQRDHLLRVHDALVDLTRPAH
ncbi:hypothetical protein [Gandjariella thermophila]|uniref:Uncharacterized protein n=1 Tax=Gandjariella thermophila TaxID=1931992 RepID=A0A4D4J7W8_9PSEU|nr:hypothetical protein [Gandjariella thermophila]GDY30758.1 hypothetical protein GTS_23910 [Gandjariella thermophila]